uniref:Uncharacterized protein n=1 Tax=Arundo donax TaxID=35708 RepID=A0A0A9FWE0_ARUDO
MSTPIRSSLISAT